MMNSSDDHDHGHGHDHAGHDHGGGALEAREKQVVMSFIEALLEGRLSVSARRAVFGILSVDPLLRDVEM